MGIKQLMSLIQERAPKAIKSLQMDMLTGKTVAVDASMAMYQFLIATQTFSSGGRPGVSELTDADGNLTGHLVGIFHRTIQFLEHGIKPIWVFDGKAPDMKAGELEKRKEQKEAAAEEKKKAEEAGDWERAKQMAGRTVRVTPEMTADAKKLVKLMGAVAVAAPCEAEAQCAEIVKQDLAFATATEDMDALTFGTKYLLRGFNSKKEPVCQIDLAQVLEGFEMTQKEFIDLCILCGCDYTQSIGGMGPVTSYKLMKEHGTIEDVLEMIQEGNDDPNKKKKFTVPEKFLYKESRDLFINPDVIRDKQELEKLIVFDKPAEEELREWLMESKGFTEVKVNNGLERMRKSQGKKNQSRLDSFFKATMISSKKVEAPKKGGKAAGKAGAGNKKAAPRKSAF